MDNNYLDKLETLGFSQKEAAVYLALLRMKKGTALSIAEAAGIKRPTVYSVLDELKKKKLVAETRYREVRDYRAYPLEHLKGYIHEQKNLVDVVLPTIEDYYEKRPHKARLRVYHDLSSVKTLVLEKSLREEAALHVIGDENVFISSLGDYWQFYLKRAQQLRIMPIFKNYRGRAQALLWSDKVAFVALGANPQMFGFKNKALHDEYLKLWTNY